MPSYPFARIITFGPLELCGRVEAVGEGSEIRYAPLSTDRLNGRGATAAFALLKILLCQPQRHAPRDLLMELLWPEQTHRRAGARLDDAASVLRTLLRPTSGENPLEYRHSNRDSGNSYHLAPYPLIWVDADAFEWYVAQACRLQRFGEDALPLWEEAYRLASRGAFLADELYSEWTRERRALLAGHYRQCVHEMTRLYRQRGARAEAERVLRAHLAREPVDEDALRPFMELLGEQERYQEALDAYLRAHEVLAQEGGAPDERTQDIAEYLRAKKITRTRTPTGLSTSSEESPKTVTSINDNLNQSIFDFGKTDKLDSAESIINLAWEAWFASRPREAAHSVNKLLVGLEKIAHSPYLPGHTLRAKNLAIRGHGLLGSVCLDASQNDTALFHYIQAHRFAEEIHDVNLTATYLCLTGDVLRRQNNQSGAISYMENARDLASNASNTTRGHILQLLAYTYGDTGQEAAFEHAISEATDLLAFSGEGIDTTQKEFIPFEIYEIRGKINRDLGKPLNAIPYLELAEKSLRAADSVSPRWYALLEISRAQTYCDAGDIVTGIELACKGFIMAYQCRSPHQMNRVRKLLRKLEKGPFQNHPKVQDLKNLLYETYIHMD